LPRAPAPALPRIESRCRGLGSTHRRAGVVRGGVPPARLGEAAVGFLYPPAARRRSSSTARKAADDLVCAMTGIPALSRALPGTPGSAEAAVAAGSNPIN